MDQNKGKSTLQVLLGAAFLMATSAIGPGFLTQTTVFTRQLLASAAFAIAVTIVVTAVVQLNIWRIICVSKLRAQDVANRVIPGLGYLLAFAVALGGLAFNVGNVGGAALGLNTMIGLNVQVGAAVSAAIAVFIFLNRDLGKAMDRFTQLLGFLMIALMLYVAFKAAPPVALAAKETVMPSTVNWMIILTLIGGTVGGYISFSGAHRLIDAGVYDVRDATKSAVNGIVVTSIMRILLFLAVLGVVYVAAGQPAVVLDAANPAADAFRKGAGEVGYRMFGVVLWAAGVTSVIGASYTSVSFLRSLFAAVDRNYRWWMIGFICASTAINIFIARPVALLIVAGSINGLILPLALASILLGAYKKDVVGPEYRHPAWLTGAGWVVVAFTLWMGVKALPNIMKIFS
ncbi:divalent metal cation transporter [Pyramidobacter sp. SM-530-WT-4B]|uniref:Divalent metal cation transporter n=2 Tax=Pyramidobacter porci TaxID=2605789 RepID=A0A6L5YF68_9BACT|nr:NRAMP family divalent metal transporter [Pyramidobacter porci]MST56628.1 divalent metal cation transporter [Pyramidobacter porci]